MEEIWVGEMWTCWLIPSGTTPDPWSTEGNELPMLSFIEYQHILKKYPPQGVSRCTTLGVMFSPPPDRLPKFSRRRGQRG